MHNKFTYGKEERLKSRKLIGSVFGSGKSFLQFPIKVTYLLTDSTQDSPVKAGVGVSTRYFKKAVDRNRVKRLLRETYRLNKQPLTDYCTENNVHIAIFFLYVDKNLPEYGPLEIVMQSSIKKLMGGLKKKHSEDKSQENK